MSYKTVEVELENGRVRPSGAETLPVKAHALVTVLDHGTSTFALTCSELAERWSSLNKLTPAEAGAFADDLENSRRHLPPLKSGWD